MQKQELENYLSRRVEIILNNSQKFKGFMIRIDDENIILKSCQYSQEKIIPINQIISIRILMNFLERVTRKTFFWDRGLL